MSFKITNRKKKESSDLAKSINGRQKK